MPAAESFRFSVRGKSEVSALLMRPRGARFLLALAHGAGAGMSHPFMKALADELATAGVATFRYQFPYMEQGRRAPDAPATLQATVAAAVSTAEKIAAGPALFAGGKSMGGRMTSQAAAQGELNNVRGLVFFGFPLHTPNQPGTKRAEHLKNVTQAMLFLQGTRDAFADLKLLRPVCAELEARATLQVIESADHSFHVLKSAGKTDAEVLRELAQTAATWMEHTAVQQG